MSGATAVTRCGVVGVGILGAAVAERLASQGLPVTVCDIDPAQASALSERGVTAAGSPRELAERSDVLLLQLPDTPEVLKALGRGRLEAGLAEGSAVVLSNTVIPATPQELAERLGKRGVEVLDTADQRQPATARCMRSQGGGRIVNLSSLGGQQGSIAQGAHYSASKAGIIVLTKVAAAELAPHGVTVNAIAPAAIDGPQVDALPAERRKAIAAAIHLGRRGHPDEVAAAVAYLASPEAAYVTGATLDLNGGLFMR